MIDSIFSPGARKHRSHGVTSGLGALALTAALVTGGGYLAHRNSAGAGYQPDQPVSALPGPVATTHYEVPTSAAGGAGESPSSTATSPPSGVVDNSSASPAATATAYNAPDLPDQPEWQTAETAASDPGTVINITNVGDKIVISTTAAGTRPPRPVSSSEDVTGTQPDDITAAASTNQATDEQQSAEEPWPTANCPAELPEGSDETDAQLMTQSYGCRYLHYCQVLNDGSSDVHCWWGFSALTTESSG